MPNPVYIVQGTSRFDFIQGRLGKSAVLYKIHIVRLKATSVDLLRVIHNYVPFNINEQIPPMSTPSLQYILEANQKNVHLKNLQ